MIRRDNKLTLLYTSLGVTVLCAERKTLLMGTVVFDALCPIIFEKKKFVKSLYNC